MILTYDKLNRVKGYFTEFLLTSFYDGKLNEVEKVYFRNDKDFYHWLGDILRQCTGPCKMWSYTGEMSDDRHNFTPLEIWEQHDFKHLLYYSDDTYSFDFIK